MDPVLRSGLLSLLATANGLKPLRRTGWSSAAAFAAGWPVSELPRAVGALDVAVTARQLARGGGATTAGRLGLAAHVAAWAGLLALDRDAARTGAVLEAALVESLGPDYEVAHPCTGPVPARYGLVKTGRSRRSYVTHQPLTYGSDERRNGIDVWRRPDAKDAPVLVQVPGGAWISGKRSEQALPLMSLMTELGWVCVAIDYRLGPRNRWPAQAVDVKSAIAWVRAHIAEHGGDPSFIAVTGGSAGGHLSTLAALTPNDPDFQPGFEDVDTTVQAAVPYYGAFDLVDTDRLGNALMEPHLARMVMATARAESEDAWRAASPIHRITADAPPMFVIHGKNDSLIPIEQADAFVSRLRAASRHPVPYARVPRAQHAFDWAGTPHAEAAARAVARFLGHVWSTRETA